MFSSHTFVAGGSFTHIARNTNNYTLKGGFERLVDAVAPGAFQNSGERFNPPKCHHNTRVAVLNKLMNWVNRQDPETRDTFIMWLYGPAGTGKSAIAQTIAIMCSASAVEKGKLLASFFFSRNDSQRGTVERLVATLAYQLCITLPEGVRDEIIFAIEHDPLLLTRSFETQLTTLVIVPVLHLTQTGFFNNAQAPCLVIIDGLDECYGPDVQQAILHSLVQLLQHHSIPLLFLIASRPEFHISSVLNMPSVTPAIIARLALDDSYNSLDDIWLFFRDKFQEIKDTHHLKQHIPFNWPGKEALHALVTRSSGQFIYASTVIDFVGSPYSRPTKQLEIVLGTRPADGEIPFAELDALYSQIFSRVRNLPQVLQMMAILVHHQETTSLHTNQIEDYLFLDPGDLPLLLVDLGSLLSLVRHNPWSSFTWQVKIHHASLADFLLDISRSKELCINTPEQHTEYALLFFRHLDRLDRVDTLQRVLRPLFYHSSRALVTDEFRKKVLKLSPSWLLQQSKTGAWFIAPKGQFLQQFIRYLESLASGNVDDPLHRDRKELLARFFLQHLETYYSDPFLRIIVTTYPMIESCYRPLFLMPKTSLAIDSRLGFFAVRCHTPLLQNYLKLLSDILHDPERSGEYFLGSTQYAKAAICGLTYISNSWSYRLFAYSDHDRRIRRYNPRRWREKKSEHGALQPAASRRNSRRFCTRFTEFQCFNSFQPQQRYTNLYRHNSAYPSKLYFNQARFSYEKEQRGREIFHFALVRLPFLLDRAGKSRELCDIAHWTKFGTRASIYPKATLRAKSAIKRYLDRCVDGE